MDGTTMKQGYAFNSAEHLHTLDGQPLIGTSTAVQVLAKPLTYWAAGLAVKEFGCPEPKLLTKLKNGRASKKEMVLLGEAAEKALGDLKGFNPLDLITLWGLAYRAHSKELDKSITPGVDMHAALESYINICIYDNHGEPLSHGLDASHAAVTTFAEWAYGNVREFLWSEAHCYSQRLWTGGICDCGAILKGNAHGNALAIIDFKSSREAYFSQFVQVGGYAKQIAENGLWRADGSAISTAIKHIDAHALIVFPFGGNCEPVIKRNVIGYSAAFEAAVILHKLQKLFEDGADFAPARNFGVQREAHAAGISNDEIQKPPSSRSGQSENADFSTHLDVVGTDGGKASVQTVQPIEPVGITETLPELMRRNKI